MRTPFRLMASVGRSLVWLTYNVWHTFNKPLRAIIATRVGSRRTWLWTPRPDSCRGGTSLVWQELANILADPTYHAFPAGRQLNRELAIHLP